MASLLLTARRAASTLLWTTKSVHAGREAAPRAPPRRIGSYNLRHGLSGPHGTGCYWCALHRDGGSSEAKARRVEGQRTGLAVPILSFGAVRVPAATPTDAAYVTRGVCRRRGSKDRT